MKHKSRISIMIKLALSISIGWVIIIFLLVISSFNKIETKTEKIVIKKNTELIEACNTKAP